MEKRSEPQQAPDPQATQPSDQAQREQPDIAHDVQKGLGKANSKDDPAHGGQPRPALNTPDEKATQFDGNPNPAADPPGGLFKPRDDTPAILEKKSGPRN